MTNLFYRCVSSLCTADRCMWRKNATGHSGSMDLKRATKSLVKHKLFSKEDDRGKGSGGHHLSWLNHRPSWKGGIWTVVWAATWTSPAQPPPIFFFFNFSINASTCEQHHEWLFVNSIVIPLGSSTSFPANLLFSVSTLVLKKGGGCLPPPSTA